MQKRWVGAWLLPFLMWYVWRMCEIVCVRVLRSRSIVT